MAGEDLIVLARLYAIAEANRIFDFDGWDRETVECLQAREAGGTWSAIYSARVCIKVRALEDEIIRDGHGTGEAYSPSLGEVYDRALKAGETDATKRALATFGKPYGRVRVPPSNRRAVLPETPRHRCRRAIFGHKTGPV